MATHCSVKNCPNLADKKTLGVCAAHNRRRIKYGDFRADIPLKRIQTRTCGLEGCDEPHRARDLCSRHLRQVYDDREISLANKIAPFGSGHLDKRGYISIQKNGVVTFEHRWIMEEMIGRKLLKNENVHHKNGIRHDNRPENLELWVTSQPAGQRPEDLLVWAHEIIDRYEGVGGI